MKKISFSSFICLHRMLFGYEKSGLDKTWSFVYNIERTFNQDGQIKSDGTS